jgi:tripeptidyl-peptidase II
MHILKNDVPITSRADVAVMIILQDLIPLSFYSEPDGSVIGSGTFKSCILIPGYFLLRCSLFLIELTLCHIYFLFLFLFFREPEAFYVGPPSREKIPKVLIFMVYILVIYHYQWSYDFVFMLSMLIGLQNAQPGSVLVGTITYGTVSTFNKKDDQNQHAPASYSISYTIPPSKVSSSTICWSLLYS